MIGRTSARYRRRSAGDVGVLTELSFFPSALHNDVARATYASAGFLFPPHPEAKAPRTDEAMTNPTAVARWPRRSTSAQVCHGCPGRASCRLTTCSPHLSVFIRVRPGPRSRFSGTRSCPRDDVLAATSDARRKLAAGSAPLVQRPALAWLGLVAAFSARLNIGEVRPGRSRRPQPSLPDRCETSWWRFGCAVSGRRREHGRAAGGGQLGGRLPAEWRRARVVSGGAVRISGRGSRPTTRVAVG